MTNDSNKLIGIVCWFNHKGWGFITPDDGTKDIFVHYSDIVMDGFKLLKKGQRVSYEIGVNKRGEPKAINVVIIE